MKILEITASMVQTLKIRTDAGMYACRDALYLTNGDLDLAAEVLQRQGSLVYYGVTGFDPTWIKAVMLRFNVDKDQALECLLSCGWSVKKIFSYFKEPFPMC